MNLTQSITLHNAICKLEPLTLDYHDLLLDSIKDGELWNLWLTLIPPPDRLHDELVSRLERQEQGEMMPFVICDTNTGKTLGMTTFLNIDMPNKRLEIGGTWIRKSAQGTGINKASKLLLLTHAFESLDCNAVEFRTHIHNRISRQSIESLGARLDGILRNHMVMPDGTLRDTCVYSIIKGEWPTVKKLISNKLHYSNGNI